MRFNIITIILSLILFTSLINGYIVSDIDIVKQYTNDTSISFEITGSLSDTSGITDNKILLKLNSDKSSEIDFNADVSSSSFSGDFYIDLDSNSSSTKDGWPQIVVNDSDTVILSDKDNNNQDNLIVDNLKPNTPSINSILSPNSHNEYYTDDLTISINNSTDNETYIDKFISYFVLVEDLDNYNTDYEYKFATDNNTQSDITVDLTQLNDGNYYVLVDANDIASNYADSTDVKATKEVVYIDNTIPEISSFNLSTDNSLDDQETYYVSSDDFVIDIEILENGSGINYSNPPTEMKVYNPEGTLINNYRDYNVSRDSFYHPITNSWTDGNNFDVNLYVFDNLDNNLSLSFDLMIDSLGPSESTTSVGDPDVDQNITISYTSSTDSASGLKEYRIYRDTSSFSSISSSQDLIETRSPSDSRSYEDTSDKSLNQRYYYAVVAVDYANNFSDFSVQSTRTGPNLSIDIDDDLVNDNTPSFELEFSSDVNLIRLSCNNSSFTDWKEVSGDSEIINDFSIAQSSYGCTTDDGEKTIYIQAKSEDDPYLTTTKSIDLEYDSTSPTVPYNVEVTERTNGSLDIEWDECDDNSGIDFYKVYISESSNVTTSDDYEISYNNEFNYNPNIDDIFYFKVLSVDNVGNESSLSSEVSGTTKRIGPEFSIDVSPSNIIDDVIYLKKGDARITITSDENLDSIPSLKIKLDSKPTKTLYLSKTSLTEYFIDHNFTESGTGYFEVSGENTNSQEATDTFDIIVDTNVPDYNLVYEQQDEMFYFNLENISEDVFRVQYLINNDELCYITNDTIDSNQDSNVSSSSVFSCDFNSLKYEDGFYNLTVNVYDIALNYNKKKLDLEIDNIDEQEARRLELVSKINSNLSDVESSFDLLESFLINISDNQKSRLEEAKQKIELAKSLEEKDIENSNSNYSKANELLIDLVNELPKKTISKNNVESYDFDKNSFSLTTKYVSDVNILNDTNSLYSENKISIDRNFIVYDISGSKYFVVDLIIKNNSSSSKEISFIENIPKEFASDIKDLTFNKEVKIIDSDPIILYSANINANDSLKLSYRYTKELNEFDVVTKYDLIEFKKPILYSGFLSLENITYSSKIDFKLLGYLSIIFLVIILIIVVVILIKSKSKKEIKLNSPKEEVNKYLGSNNSSKPTFTDLDDNSKQESNTDKSKDTNDYENNYEFILNAIKRDKKDN